jgi:rod shape-determining protein MreD
MAILLAIPIFGFLVVIQSAILSRITLAFGAADLVLLTIIAWGLNEKVETAWHWALIGGLMMSLVSAVPFGALLIGYLLTTFITLLLRRRVWKVPILAMFIAIFSGTVILHLLTVISLWISGVSIPILDSFYLITLPTLILNLLLAIPIYVIIKDLANWLYPEKIDA